MQKIFDRIIKISLYSLTFLVPLFFLPFSFEAFEYNKQYLLFFLVSLAFFTWLAKMVLIDKEIRFKRSPLDPFVLAFLFIAIISAVFSVDKGSSIFGFYGRFSDGLINLLSLGMLYFLITNNVKTQVVANGLLANSDGYPSEKKSAKINNKPMLISASGLTKMLLWSVFFVILFSYFSIFGVWTKFNNLFSGVFSLPTVMLQSIFNPTAGSMEGLAVFLAIILVFLVGRILTSTQKANCSHTERKIGNLIKYLLLIAILVLLLIIDFSMAWIVIVVSLVLFLAVALGKRMFKDNVNRLLLPILITVVAGVLLFVDTPIFNFQLPQEQVLGQDSSWLIGFKGATENIKSGFLGSGIGTWHYDFSKFRPESFNQSFLWQIRFDRAGSYVAEILGTMGFLGILSYLFLIGIFLIISYLFLEQKNLSGLPLLMAFLALLIGQFVYYQNTVLAFTFWLILGLSVVNWQKPISEKAISFKNFPELSLVFSTCFVILGLVVLGMYFFAVKFYLADINYKKAFIEEQTQNLGKAVNLNPWQAQYKIVLARDYLNKVFLETQKPPAERDQAALSTNVYLALTYAKGGQIGNVTVKGALELSPNRVISWETLGMIYRDIQSMAAGSLEWGIKSFEKAITLEPSNPVLHTELGKLYLVSGDTERAKATFNKAKELKPDYVDASIQMALISERENNLSEAVKQMEDLASAYPFNAEVLFQLGRLYFNNNQLDEAISQFEKVISLMPNHSNTHYSLGIAYQKKGEIGKAIAEFEKVLELNPGNPDVQARLEELR